jgi:hypothetical protein
MSDTRDIQPGEIVDTSDMRTLANAVEALCNVFYLIDNAADNPETVRAYIKIGTPALNVLVGFVKEAQSSGLDSSTCPDGREQATGDARR